MTLYAVWVPKDTTYNFQTLASANRCSTMSEGDIIALQDSRDSNIYTVAKLADGSCWITENLRLDPSDSNISITASNTNNPTSTFINTDITLSNITDKTGKKAYTNNYFRTCTDTNSTNGPSCMNQISFGLGNITLTNTANYNNNSQVRAWYAYGIMYNWYTATAGNGSYNDGSGVVANGDICPSGWHLPYGGGGTGTKGGNTDGGFYYLNYKINNNSNVTSNSIKLREFPNNFVYSGLYSGTSARSRGTNGYYWSSTANNNTYGYGLNFFSSSVSPGTGSNVKYFGCAVRCLAD